MKSSTETVCAALKHLAHPSTVWGMMEHISNTRGKSYIIAVHTEGVYGISPISSRNFFLPAQENEIRLNILLTAQRLKAKGHLKQEPIVLFLPSNHTHFPCEVSAVCASAQMGHSQHECCCIGTRSSWYNHWLRGWWGRTFGNAQKKHYQNSNRSKKLKRKLHTSLPARHSLTKPIFLSLGFNICSHK